MLLGLLHLLKQWHTHLHPKQGGAVKSTRQGTYVSAFPASAQRNKTE
jgi:hypothetical protein